MSAQDVYDDSAELCASGASEEGSTPWDEQTNAEIDAAAELIPDEAIVTESHGMLTAILA